MASIPHIVVLWPDRSPSTHYCLQTNTLPIFQDLTTHFSLVSYSHMKKKAHVGEQNQIRIM